MFKYLSVILFLAGGSIMPLLAQSYNNQTIAGYIEEFRTISVQEMEEYGIPASITLAQGILESGAGQSELARLSNNHFGIKCHGEWNGKKVFYDDDSKGECFRKYKDPYDSFRDHSEFLSSRSRYAFLWEYDATNYKAWAKGLKKAGYATNPQYAHSLINLIERYDLDNYDNLSYSEVLAMSDPQTQQKQKNHHKKSKSNPKKHKKEPAVDQPTVKIAPATQDIFYTNRIKTVLVKEGESPSDIATLYGIRLKTFCRYNEIGPNSKLTPGTKMYLQPKRKKGDKKYHETLAGETMFTISQKEGVRLDELCQRNLVDADFMPQPGQLIYLRKDRQRPPLQATNATPQSKPVIETKIEKRTETKAVTTPKTENKTDTKSDPVVSKPRTETVKQPETKSDPVVSKPDTIEKEEMKTDPVVEKTAGNIESVVEKAGGENPVATTPIIHVVQPKETLYSLSKRYKTTVDNIRQWNRLPSNDIKIGQKLVVGHR